MNQTTTPSGLKLSNLIGTTLIIAYKENTDDLEKVLTSEKMPYRVLRQEGTPPKGFSPSYLCLLNHKRAWEFASNQSKPTLIVEADFVPVVDFGKLPLPFNPEKKNTGVAWLYTCAPQIYSISAEGYANGFSVSTVAYVVTPEAAKQLIQLEEKIRKEVGTNCYSSWDSMLDSFLRQKKFKNYLSFRNYGEHGGLANPEHQLNGLSKCHRADVLWNQLAFRPMYASTASETGVNFWLVRLKYRAKGILRLLLGKYVRLKILKNSSNPMRLLNFAIGRQLSLFL